MKTPEHTPTCPSTYTANMLRGFGPRPSRLHQAMPLTMEGCFRLCRQRHPEPEWESGAAHSFTVSSLAQVIKICPVGLHFILVMDSWCSQISGQSSQLIRRFILGVASVHLVSINDHDGSVL